MRLVLLGLTFLALLSCEPREQTVFKYVCEEVEAAHGEPCGRLKPPLVVRTSILDHVKGGPFRGSYAPGEPYVFINPGTPDAVRSETHETAHYVLYSLLGWSTGEHLCVSEAEARRIAKQPGDDWRKKYGCVET